MIPFRKYWILLLVLIAFSCNNVKEGVIQYAPTSKAHFICREFDDDLALSILDESLNFRDGLAW